MATTDEFELRVSLLVEESVYEPESWSRVTLREFCLPVRERRSNYESGTWGEPPVEGLAFELVASDGKVLESAPVYFVEDILEFDPADFSNGSDDSYGGRLIAVVEHRSDWSTFRFMQGSEVIYEAAEPDRRRNKCG